MIRCNFNIRSFSKAVVRPVLTFGSETRTIVDEGFDRSVLSESLMVPFDIRSVVSMEILMEETADKQIHVTSAENSKIVKLG